MTPAPPATNTRITLTLSSSRTGCRHQDETAHQLVTSETAPATPDASEHHRTERETHSSISALLWLPARGFSAGSGWAVFSGGLPRRRRGGGRAREGIDDHR